MYHFGWFDPILISISISNFQKKRRKKEKKKNSVICILRFSILVSRSLGGATSHNDPRVRARAHINADADTRTVISNSLDDARSYATLRMRTQFPKFKIEIEIEIEIEIKIGIE